MATNNAVNLSASGIVSYNGSGTFSALANPLTVANGGQGNSSLTAYAVLCGGTSTTNPYQSIASVGTSGQVLTSNGAGALPTFQTPAGGSTAYTLEFHTASNTNMSDSTTYYVNGTSALTTTESFSYQLQVPSSGTITAAYGAIYVGGTLGTSENISVLIRLNSSSSTTITSTAQATAALNSFNNTGLSISVSAGDYISLRIVTPAFSTNPTSTGITCTVLVT